MGSDSAFDEPFYEYNKESIRTIEVMVDYIRKWQHKLGLVDWEIHVEESESEENRAWVKCNLEGRVATVLYDKAWYKEVTEREIERVTFHEMCEILMSKLFVDLYRFYNEEYIQERLHEIIRTMEHVVLGQV